MAIVKMKRFELFALDKDREKILADLQKFRYVHFVKTEAEDEEHLEEIQLSPLAVCLQEKIRDLKWMIEYLKKRQSKVEIIEYDFKDLKEVAEAYSYKEDHKKLTGLAQEAEDCKQELMQIQAKEVELEPWKAIEASIGTMKKLKTKIHIGRVSAKAYPALAAALEEKELLYYEKLPSDSTTANLLILVAPSMEEEVEEVLQNFAFAEEHFDFEQSIPKELEAMQKREIFLKEKQRLLEEEMEEMAKDIVKMEAKEEYLENLLLREMVTKKFKKTDYVDVIEGYIPADLEDEFRRRVNKISENKNELLCYELAKDEGNVPIMLKNSKFFNLFEAITEMYALPRYNEVDPTPILALFYWLFFGMMVADFAYGLILCIGCYVVLHFVKIRESMRKFVKFFFALSFSTMLWGLLYGSAFGDLVKLPTQILDPSKDFMDILILSIIFGGVHLMVALGIKAYVVIRNFGWKDAFYDVFLWYITLAAIILLLLGDKLAFSSSIRQALLVLMGLGMLGIVAFSARDAESIGGRIGGGLYSLYGITGYIGDFVSYLRLMALGLAGGFIAIAINIIVRKLAGAGFVGIFFGIIVFALGQSFNIFLSLLSSYVHTSRLIYVEFFSKFYEGGGKAFQKFRVKSKYFEMKEEKN